MLFLKCKSYQKNKQIIKLVIPEPETAGTVRSIIMKKYVKEAKNILGRNKWYRLLPVSAKDVLIRIFLLGFHQEGDGEILVKAYEKMIPEKTDLDFLFSPRENEDYYPNPTRENAELFKQYLFDNFFGKSEEGIEHFNFLLEKLKRRSK